MSRSETDLITSLEQAGEGSRKLDVAVYAHVEGIAETLAELRWQAFAPVTTSLDAALALAERVLPGWDWSVTTITTSIGGVKKVNALIVHPSHPDGQDITTFGEADTPALALCLAILKATNPKGQPNV